MFAVLIYPEGTTTELEVESMVKTLLLPIRIRDSLREKNSSPYKSLEFKLDQLESEARGYPVYYTDGIPK